MYLKVKANVKGYTHLNVSTFYDKGGYNHWNGAVDSRGYYVSVAPVEKHENMISQALFEGAKKFIEPANRLSKKKLDMLSEKTLENAEALITHVCNKYGCELVEPVEVE